MLQSVVVGRADEIGLNGAVLAFGASVSLFTGLLFGLVPAVRPGASFALEWEGERLPPPNLLAGR